MIVQLVIQVSFSLYIFLLLQYHATRRDPDADTVGRWLESHNVYSSKGVGKRMVVDRQKGPNQIRVQEVQSGRQTRGQGRENSQAGGYNKMWNKSTGYEYCLKAL